jgi:glycolate oxidase iron-sulfur subunit
MTVSGVLDLGLDDEELSSCVACGLCLPHCPTFRVTGEEGLSPRGRIDAMRNVQWRGAAADDDFVRFMETCVQCRGCEPACPSGVPFGRLMEGTRVALAGERRTAPRWLRAGLAMLRHHRVVLAGSSVLAVAQRARLVPRRAGLGRIPLRRGPALESTGTDVWLVTGCVMDAWMRSTHRATADLITRMGFTYSVPDSAGCCGALHTHAGLEPQARRLAESMMRAMPGDAPVLVNSAGCGAAMKDYGHLLDTAEARAFSARVRDVHEWVAEHLDRMPPTVRRSDPVIVQDPCHLRHVQRTQGRRHRAGGRSVGRDSRREREPGVPDASRRRRARRPAPARRRRRGGPAMTRYQELAERLEAIGVELDELSFDLLQQAVADGATQRPAADRALTQARRAVEKAAGLLRRLQA